MSMWMDSQWRRSNTSSCLPLSKTWVMMMVWARSMMRWSMTVKWASLTCLKSKSLKKILFRTKFKRSFRFALITMPFLEILSSQQTIVLYTMTQWIHQSTLLTCQWLNGRDHKRSLLMASQRCIEMPWHQEILSRVSLETAGSLARFWSRVQTLSSSTI